MKRLILILFIGLVSCGTDQGEGKKYNFTIQNLSGTRIVIKSYNSKDNGITPLIITLENGESLSKEFKESIPPPPSPITFGNFFGTKDVKRDSIRIIFNNSKLKVFTTECTSDHNGDNPLNFCFYNSTDQVYVMNLEDFENASLCNSGCE